MKKSGLTNTFGEKVAKTTLKDYYDGLPAATYRKTDLVNEMVTKTKVSSTTARNWIKYGMKPLNPKHREIVEGIIRERTGMELVW